MSEPRLVETGALEDGTEPQHAYLKRMGQGRVDRLVSNVSANVRAISGDGFCLPVVLPLEGEANCYVCSFLGHFCDYARYEIQVRKLGGLERVLSACLRGLQCLMLVARSERAVFVNNWLLSTNLYPPGLEDEVERIRDCVMEAEPERAVVFRSLNRESNGALVASLERAGFIAVCSREIYLLDTLSGAHRRRSNYRRDVRFLGESGFGIVRGGTFSERDLPRALELYGKLYLEKYTELNPRFTLQMFREGMRSGFLNFLGVKRQGELVGVLAYYRCGDWITAPVLGYDTGLSRSLGLYRVLTTLLTLEGERLGCCVHRSSGAARFKRSRGAERHLEYSYVYAGHLPWWRRGAWRLLAGLVNRVAGFSLRRIEL